MRKKRFISIVFLLLTIIILSTYSRGLSEWLTDKTPPTLIIEGLNEGDFINSNPTISIHSEDDSSIDRVKVNINNRLIYNEKPGKSLYTNNLNIDLTGLEDKVCNLKIMITDSAASRNSTEKIITFTLDKTPPLLTFPPGPATVLQGRVYPLMVRLEDLTESEINLHIDNRSIPFYKINEPENNYRALISFSAIQKTGSYPFTVTATDRPGNKSVHNGIINVEPFSFPSEVIRLSPTKSKLLAPQPLNLDRIKIEGALKTSHSLQLWQSLFITPTEGAVSSVFGIRRDFGTGSYTSFHKGIDLANIEGTPIYAANSGQVVLAEELPVHGNTVIIDHGQNVFTIYAHMQKIESKPGERVEKGKLIGLMGQTGLVTGPHLHWELRVNGIQVDPDQWVLEAF